MKKLAFFSLGLMILATATVYHADSPPSFLRKAGVFAQQNGANSNDFRYLQRENCGSISDNELRYFCRKNCGSISNSYGRYLCRNNCGSISNSTLRDFCRNS